MISSSSSIIQSPMQRPLREGPSLDEGNGWVHAMVEANGTRGPPWSTWLMKVQDRMAHPPFAIELPCPFCLVERERERKLMD